jgi:predicted esterase
MRRARTHSFLIGLAFAVMLGCGGGRDVDTALTTSTAPANDAGSPAHESDATVPSVAASIVSTEDAGAGTEASSPAPKDGPTGVRKDFPCTSCLVDIPTSYTPGTKAPLVVILHGDGGTAGAGLNEMGQVTRPAGAILFSPACPSCPEDSWWRWLENQEGSRHDPKWLINQIDAISAEYDIDERRMYFMGVSGGADYLGWWAPTYYDKVAAVGLVVGGAQYVTKCPPASCKYGTYFISGTGDFSRGYVIPAENWYLSCGHEVEERVEQGVGHAGFDLLVQYGYNQRLWDWFSPQTACDL